MGNKKLISLFITVLVIAAVGVSVWYWPKKSPAPSSRSTPQPVSQTPAEQKTVDVSLGSQILQKTQNPTKDKLPETNPFQTETNPLKAQYINPFK